LLTPRQMFPAWRQWGCSIVLLAVALSLQGCGPANALTGSPHSLSLLAVHDSILVSPPRAKHAVRPAELQDDAVARPAELQDDDEDADAIDVPENEEHRRTKQSPGFSLLSTGSSDTSESADTSDSADFDGIARGSDSVKSSTLDKALQVDLKQQKELQDEYAKMLYLQDPDDVEKATQLAWMKMEYEDHRLTKDMLKDDPSHTKGHLRSRTGMSQLQLGNTIGKDRRPRMLNARARSAEEDSERKPALSAPVQQLAAAPAPYKASDPSDDADIADF